MSWCQKEISLRARSRGFHLITDEILNQLTDLKKIKTGLMHFLIKHTSASITLNENYDPDVRSDMEKYFSRTVKENEPWYEHNSEGSDDMPAHIKSALTQTQLSIPIRNHNMAMGIWQGIYIFEHRAHAHKRTLSLHMFGE